MGWREDLLEASIGGLPFYVARHQADFGRQIVIHKRPGADKAYIEDQGGRDPDEYSLDAFVIGDDYMVARDDIIDLLANFPGPHQLIHPYLGEKQVVLNGKLRLNESAQEDGGMASFQMPLIEWAPPEFPLIRDTSDAVAAAVVEVQLMTIENMGNKFKANEFLGGLINGLLNVAGKLRSIKGKIDAKLAVIENLSAAIDQIADQVQAFIDLPAQIAADFKDLFNSVVNLVKKFVPPDPRTSPRDIGLTPAINATLAILDEFTGFDHEQPSYPDTPEGQEEAQSLQAINDMVYCFGISSSVNVLADLEPVSSQQAIAIQQKVALAIDEVLEQDTVIEDLYVAMSNLKSSFTKQMLQTAAQLPVTTTFTPKQAQPALVIAQRLYQDGARASELVSRNGPKHPLLIEDAIEVLHE